MIARSDGRIRALSALGAMLLLANACGPGGSPRVAGPALVISATDSLFGPRMTRRFAASVNGVAGAGVIWGVQEGEVAGTILADGSFTAGHTPGTYHVIAQTATTPAAADTVAITILPDPAPRFTSFPDSIDAAAGGAATFAVAGAAGLANEWSIHGGTYFGGTPTDSGGAFTGLDTARFVAVSLRSTNAAGRSATITDSARVLGRDLTLADRTYALAIGPTNVIASMEWLGERVRFRSGATLGVLREVNIGSTPIHGVFSRDGNAFYVVLQSSRQVARITVGSTQYLTVGIGHSPFNIARSDAGDAVFVTTADGWLLRLDPTTLALQDSLPIHAPSNGIAARAGQLWVATFGGVVYHVDPATLEMLDSVEVGGSPQRVALNADASRLYVANEGSRSYNVVTTANGAITTTPVMGGGEPIGVALSPDGAEAWFTVRSGRRVDRYDANTMTFLDSIAIGGSPRDIVFSDDGRLVLVGAESHSMLIRR